MKGYYSLNLKCSPKGPSVYSLVPSLECNEGNGSSGHGPNGRKLHHGGYALEGDIISFPSCLFEVSNRYAPIMTCYATIPHNNVAK